MTLLTAKSKAHRFLAAQSRPGIDRARSAAQAFIASDAKIQIVHPFNDLSGVDGYVDGFLSSLHASFSNLTRRTDILIGGNFDDSAWVSCHGYFTGNFTADWLGLTHSNRLEFMRYGEFFRIKDGQAVEVTGFLDIPQLMCATGQWPIHDSPGATRGYVGVMPGPATQDGLVLTDQADDITNRTLDIVETMLRALGHTDQAWRANWHDDMMWYGPAGFGAFSGLADFSSFQVPFEQAFDTWSGGYSGNGVTRHFTRFADGHYACIAGWPSLMCKRRHSFLDQPSDDQTVYMRVCDWWRRDTDKLAENWVLVDLPDVLLQMGCDLFEGFHDQPSGPRKIIPAARAVDDMKGSYDAG
jgi:hypothetical protein